MQTTISSKLENLPERKLFFESPLLHIVCRNFQKTCIDPVSKKANKWDHDIQKKVLFTRLNISHLQWSVVLRVYLGNNFQCEFTIWWGRKRQMAWVHMKFSLLNKAKRSNMYIQPKSHITNIDVAIESNSRVR